jgi:hypothetical protein
MKAFILLAASILAIQAPSGCDSTAKPAVKPVEHHVPPAHRFENVPGIAGDGIALDTVTGQWCRTWEWHYKVASMSGGLDTLPLCIDIFRSNPATGDPNDPLGLFPAKPTN